MSFVRAIVLILRSSTTQEHPTPSRPSRSVSVIDMRLIKQNIERKDGSGSATLLPEEPEDMVSESVSTKHDRL